MATRFASSYANLFMGTFDSVFIVQSHLAIGKIALYRRFIDGLFLSFGQNSVEHVFENCFPPVSHPLVEEEIQPLESLLHDVDPPSHEQTRGRSIDYLQRSSCEHTRDPDALYKWKGSLLHSGYLSCLHINPNDKRYDAHIAIYYVGCAIYYAGCAIYYAGCAIYYAGWAICYAGWAICYVGCAIYYGGWAIYYAGCAIYYVRWAIYYAGCAIYYGPPHRSKFSASSPVPKQRPQHHKMSTGLARDPELKLMKVASVSVHVTGFSPSHHLQSLFQHWSQPSGKTRLKVAYEFNRSLLV
ncbi:unnamed protein product [Ranitomeya imitator]|uniref:Uncharacterized protein n=1 Tax=Ranitomeya imitator TaxID=111125 RepID=A0ABN9LT26_9NEOB|nr:unnamed protein product [Ranitomeya imitator]